MNLKTVVKVGNVSNLSDARYCAGFGVDMIGFNLDTEDDEHISIDKAKEIMGWIAGTTFVMEYGNMSVEAIKSIRTELPIDNYQVEDIDVANNLALDGHVVCFKYKVDTQEDVSELGATIDSLSSKVSFLVIESHENQLTHLINESLNAIRTSIKILKSYGVDESTVVTDIQNGKLYGIALKGSQEEKPGFKDYDELADILEALEID